MMRKLVLSCLMAVGLTAATGALAHEGEPLEMQKWSWQGIFGSYDQASQQRGFQIYKEVCSNCHSLRLLSYRNLVQLGFSEDQVKAFAADKNVQDGPNDEGNMYDRPAKPSDRFVSPFANEKAARAANNGALPPDLSLIVKARNGGPDYVYNFLLGFQDPPPPGVTLNPGMYYNKVFPGHQAGMPPQVTDDVVTYQDGTKATKEQVAKDIVTFLNWASEPELEERKSMGRRVLLFVLIMTGFFFALKKQIWSKVEH